MSPLKKLKKAVKKVAKAAKVVRQFTAWSYSRLNDYLKCPFMACCKHLRKNELSPEPENDAMRNGGIVHQLGQSYVERALTKLPPEFKNLAAGMQMLRTQRAKCEQEWAFDRQWNPVSWFAKEAWVRIKIDAHYLTEEIDKRRRITTVHIVDYKTGKQRAEHADQRNLYALAAFVMYPDAEYAIAEHWYVDTGKKEPSSYKAHQLPGLQKQWEQRTRAMMNDKLFTARPGSYCAWCHYRKENGGPCVY